MAYSTQANIEGEFKDIAFSTDTAVKASEIPNLIAETDAEIDARLSVRYVTPITGSISLILMRTISTFITSARISKIIEVKTGEADKDQPRRYEERNNAIKMINDIVEGKMVLTDAIPVSQKRGIRSFTYENNIKPCIDIKREQW